MTENLESSKDCLLLLHWGKSAYTFWGVGVGTLGKYVVMKLSKEMECSVICMGGKQALGVGSDESGSGGVESDGSATVMCQLNGNGKYSVGDQMNVRI